MPGYERVESYLYTDALDRPQLVVDRFEDGNGNKTFRTRGSPPDEVPLLYRLPRVLAAIAARQPIYLVEGEKDSNALEAAGVVATTNAFGALHWTRGHAEFLRGAKVVVVVDDDDIGWGRALAVEISLRGLAESIQFVTAKSGNDASDHLEAGYGLADFVEIDRHEEDMPRQFEASLDLRDRSHGEVLIAVDASTDIDSGPSTG